MGRTGSNNLHLTVDCSPMTSNIFDSSRQYMFTEKEEFFKIINPSKETALKFVNDYMYETNAKTLLL